MNDPRPNVQLKSFKIVSNKGREIDISNGFSEMYYYESLVENSVKVKVTYADTGNRNYAGETSSSTESNDVDLQYAEKVFFDIEDEEKGRVQFLTEESCLRFASRPQIIGNTRSEVITANLTSAEHLTNQFEENRVNKTYEGKISETVKRILRNHLKTKKAIFVEDTLNNLKIEGRVDNYAMPFNVLRLLSSKSIPIVPSKTTKGYTAGFFFYETSDGYHFKSIDNLLAQNPIKTYVLNNTPYLPAWRDAKILDYTFHEGPALLDLQKVGTDGFTIRTFNPITHKVETNTIDSSQMNKGKVSAGKKLIDIPQDLKKSTRAIYIHKDFGQLNYGTTTEEQIKNSFLENLNVSEIVRQSIMRVSQLFSLSLEVTIFCDVTLHAGDVIECVFPEVSAKQTQVVSNKKSGKYLIRDLCHYITPVGPNFTKLFLVRDSYGG